MNTPHLIAAAVAALLLSACSSTPERHVALEQARQQFALAQADPQTSRHAADEMRRARSAIDLAEQARVDGHPRIEIDHLAYLAGQRVAIAQASAEARAAQAQLAGAATERDRMLMTQRTLETERAEQALVRAQLKGQQQQASADRDAVASALRDLGQQAQIGSLEQQLREMDARKTERGHVLTLGDMLFDSGRATLQAGAQRRIARVADFMRRHPTQRARIEGYTDSQGSEASNLSLSGQRADAVLQALVGLGVASDRMSPHGQGEAMPVASNDSSSGRQANRRVEIVFLMPVGAQAADATVR